MLLRLFLFVASFTACLLAKKNTCFLADPNVDDGTAVEVSGLYRMLKNRMHQRKLFQKMSAPTSLWEFHTMSWMIGCIEVKCLLH